MSHLTQLIADYPALAPCAGAIEAAFTALRDTITNGGRIYVCGNGGSAADCQHITGEMMKGFLKKRPVTLSPQVMAGLSPQTAQYLSANLQGAIPCHSLTTETALISAITNDTAGDMPFAQQVYGYCRPGDTLIAISTSGNAQNVCLAAELATAMGVKTIALTGEKGGKLATVSTIAIQAPSQSTPKIQEYHLPIYHALCAAVEAHFFSQ